MPTVLHITAPTHCNIGMLTVLWACTLVASATCGLLVYSIASFRNAAGDSPVSFVRRTAMEVAWAMIPILILIGTAAPAVKALVTAENNCGSALHARPFDN
jgi:heme/copper-type cytochrome/quinol oxidase subunit 2